jgi:hypothetical protein
MSDMVDRYNNSDSQRVKDARNIPGNEVNYFDRNSEFQKQFDNFPEFKKTTFTDKALNTFDDKLQNYSVPESFTPLEPGITLNRWNPKKKYYNPGQAQR